MYVPKHQGKRNNQKLTFKTAFDKTLLYTSRAILSLSDKIGYFYQVHWHVTVFELQARRKRAELYIVLHVGSAK
jgi:hypothetical protein